ncbi:MAG TPA: hypothetical protein VMH22_11560 [bacterium]|nr:hypothetical protein [bacterium]
MRTPIVAFCLVLLLVGIAQADSLYFRQVGHWGGSQLVGVAVKGEYAFVVGLSDDGYDGLHVLSLADLSHPEEVWRCSTMAVSRNLAVSGEYVYYADDTAGMRIFSVSNPANPVQVGCWKHEAWDLAVGAECAYVIDSMGLSIVSVADPTHPTEVGRINDTSGLQMWEQVEVGQEHAYVASRASGLHIISIADRAHPVEVGKYTPGPVYGVALSGSLAYVGCQGSFKVVSVADPSNPVEIGSLDSTPFNGWGMVLRRGYAFAAGGMSSGLWAISISAPTHPTLAGYYGGGFGWCSLVGHGDYVYYCGLGFQMYRFYQLGDLDIDPDSLDVSADTLRLKGAGSWARGEFILANTSAAYNPDTSDGPSVSPVASLRCTGSLTGPGGTIDSLVIPSLPSYLAQGRTVVCTLAAYVPVGLRDGYYTGQLFISGKDTAGLQVYESCYVSVRKLGDLDVAPDSLNAIADTIRVRPQLVSAGPPPKYTEYALGEFLLANTSTSYNPDTSDGPSHSPVDSLRFTGKLAGPGGTLDSILIPNLPTSLAQGQTAVCTLAVLVPAEKSNGDYAGAITISGKDTAGFLIGVTFYALARKLGDLDVDRDSLSVAHDTIDMHTQPAGPVYHPYAKAEFMLVNTSSAYNPDKSDGPSRSPLTITGYGYREDRVVNREERNPNSGLHSSSFTLHSSARGAAIHPSQFTIHSSSSADSTYVLNLPESLAIGQAVKCTLALVIPTSESLGSRSGWVVVSALDTAGYQVQDSFFLKARGPQPRQNLDSLRVAPIPFKPHTHPEQDAIHFQGLSAGARVTIYDNSGQSVWSAVEHGDGHLEWDAKVASGIYVYLVVSADGKSSKVGKLSVIR